MSTSTTSSAPLKEIERSVPYSFSANLRISAGCAEASSAASSSMRWVSTVIALLRNAEASLESRALRRPLRIPPPAPSEALAGLEDRLAALHQRAAGLGGVLGRREDARGIRGEDRRRL